MSQVAGIRPPDCDDYPSLSKIERDTGLDRREVRTLIIDNDIPYIFNPPAIRVTPEGMRRLIPIIEAYKTKQEAFGQAEGVA